MVVARSDRSAKTKLYTSILLIVSVAFALTSKCDSVVKLVTFENPGSKCDLVVKLVTFEAVFGCTEVGGRLGDHLHVESFLSC